MVVPEYVGAFCRMSIDADGIDRMLPSAPSKREKRFVRIFKGPRGLAGRTLRIRSPHTFVRHMLAILQKDSGRTASSAVKKCSRSAQPRTFMK